MALESDLSMANLQLFFDMVHLDMEDKIQEHEMGLAENEDVNLDFLRPEHVKQLMLVKIRAFGAMIKQVREKVTEMYEKRKADEKDHQMKDDQRTILQTIDEHKKIEEEEKKEKSKS